MNQPVSSLNLPQNTVQKLEKSGFFHCNDLTEPITEEIPKTQTAWEVLQEENAADHVTVLNPQLEALLKDELKPGLLTELTGLPGAGKTQICFHLAVGTDGNSFFITTNSNFAPDRLREIAQGYSTDVEALLDRVHVLEVCDPMEFFAAVRFLESWLEEHQIKLLIIDSFSWPMRQKDFTERNLIYPILQNLRTLSRLHRFAVVLTNDFTTRIGTSAQVYRTPHFGERFFHLINNRIVLSRKNKGFVGKIVKSTVSVPKEIELSL